MGILLVIALATMRMHGLGVGDVLRLARTQLARMATDARELTSQQYADRYARRLREEAARIPLDVQGAEGKESSEISREVQAERIRLLQERADLLKSVGANPVAGDLESLKRQVEENARRAGGNP